MKDSSRLILTITTVMIVTMFAIVGGGQRALVTASSNLTNVNPPGPSQFYLQHNLLSDGFIAADLIDPNLVNAWGLDAGPTSPWWIADNGTGKSTLYNVATGTIPAVFTV